MQPPENSQAKRQDPESTGAPSLPGFESASETIEFFNKFQVYIAFLDDGFHIQWANDNFFRDITTVSQGRDFVDSLSPGTRESFARVTENFNGYSKDIELHHPLPEGMRIVTYRFIRNHDGVIAVGIDRSQEMEMISQMSVLLEELENEVKQRIALTEKLEALVITDSLTGLYNRRHFDAMLEQEWSRWERYQSRFALYLVDIDRFKSVNDTHGHQNGDEVLRRLGSTLQHAFRTGDIVARYGGEEFAVIGLGMNIDNALLVGERLRESVKKTPMPPDLDPTTVSIGVVTTEYPGVSSSHHLLRLADTYLYQAKKEGRDRIISRQHEPQTELS